MNPDKDTKALREFLNRKYAGVVSFIADETKWLGVTAECLQMCGPSKQGVVRMLKQVCFCETRWQLFRAAKFSFKKLPEIIEDHEPLRFFIPFKFCEPFGRWYRLAPFQIDLERVHSNEGAVRFHLEIQKEIEIDSKANKPTGKVSFYARVTRSVDRMPTLRYNIRLKLWRRNPNFNGA